MFQDPTTSAVQLGDIAVLRTNPPGSAPVAPASALLAAGPTQGEVSTPAEPFIIRANGSLAAPVLVTPTASGGSVTWSPISATLTSGGAVSFVPTPLSVASLTFTFSAPGLSPAVAPYESESPTLMVDLDTTWMIDVDPATPFEGSHGVIPAGVVAHAATPDPNYSPALANKAGVTNKPRAALTLGDNSGDLTRNLNQSYSDVTPTQVLLIPSGLPGGSDPTYAMFSRVADPDDGAKWSYRCQGDKTKIGFTANTTKWRAWAQSTAESQRSDPWGVEIWVAFGFRLDAKWVHAARGPFHHIFDLHDGNGGLLGGSAFDADLQPGEGNPANVQLMFTIKRYRNTDPQDLAGTWPRNQALKNKVNHEFTTSIAGGIETQKRYWGVLHYKTGNGFADYPGYDPDATPAQNPNDFGPVWGTYGSTSPNDPFVELFIAKENGAPEKIFRWDHDFAVANGIENGFWGGPMPTTESASVKQNQCYLQNGLYTSCKFQPSAQIGNDIGMHVKGFTQWRAKDAPGINEVLALDWFRAHRT